MKIALAQFNPTVGDFEGNSARILALAAQAKRRGADLAVFSELCICGYLPLDLLERPAFIQRNHDTLKERRRANASPRHRRLRRPRRPITTGQGSPSPIKPLSSSEGRVVFEQSKMLLPTYDVFDESRYFQPGEKQYVYGLGREQLGITICEDVWNDKTFLGQAASTPATPSPNSSHQGTSVLINISASPYTIDKRSLRLNMLRSIALHHQRPVIYVNQVGGDDSLIFDGASMAFTADGKVAAQAKAFEEDLVLFDTVTGEGDIHEQPADEIAYAYQALVTRHARLRPQMQLLARPSSASAAASIPPWSPAIAVDALGTDNVLGVSMPGPYSSEGSKTDAQALAHNLGIEFLTIPIAPVFDAYIADPGPGFRRSPAGRHRRKYPGAHPRQLPDGAFQ